MRPVIGRREAGYGLQANRMVAGLIQPGRLLHQGNTTPLGGRAGAIDCMTVFSCRVSG